jgi:O-antigen/teichoic acid export membrane protein
MNNRTILGFAVGPIATAVFGLVSVPIMAWAFTPEAVGRLNMVQIVVSFSVLMLSLGLDQAYVRQYHEVTDRGALLKICFLPGMLLFIVIAVPGIVLSSRISFLLFGLPNPKYFWVVLACAITAFMSRFLSLILRMQERAMAFSMSQLIPKVIFVLLIGFIVFAGFPRQFYQLQVSLLVSTIAVLLIYVWNTRKQLGPAVVAPIDLVQLRVVLKYGVPLIFAGLAYWGLEATSVLSLRSLSSFRELGIYSVAMNFAGIATVVQLIFSVVWAPIVYKWVADGADMSRVDRVGRQALAVVCAVFVLVGTFSWLIHYVLPSQYSAVKYLVLCSIAQPLLYTLSEVTSVGVNITRRTMLSVWSTLLALLVNLGLNYLLVPAYGASGAVIANALAYLVFFVARTESSAFVWRQFARVRLYVSVTALTALSVLTVIFGPATGWLFSVLWLAIMPAVAWAFRQEWRDIVGMLRGQGPGIVYRAVI